MTPITSKLLRDDPRDSDRREHPRADFGTSAIVLARHNEGVQLTIESISIGGARLVGPLALDRGERIQILFEIDQRPLEVQGEVVRVESRDVLNDTVAVRFLDLDADSRELIRGAVLRALESEDVVPAEEE